MEPGFYFMLLKYNGLLLKDQVGPKNFKYTHMLGPDPRTWAKPRLRSMNPSIYYGFGFFVSGYVIVLFKK